VSYTNSSKGYSSYLKKAAEALMSCIHYHGAKSHIPMGFTEQQRKMYTYPRMCSLIGITKGMGERTVKAQ